MLLYKEHYVTCTHSAASSGLSKGHLKNVSEITGMEASKTDFRGCATGASGQATLTALFFALF